MNEDINVILLDFPNTKGYEMCVENEDGSYTILINARMSSDRQREAYEHAIDHIRNNDFEKDSVQEIESMAHGIIPRDNPVAVYKGSEQVSAWIERLKAERKKIHRQFERRWKRNNLRAEMGFDFFAQEQERLDNLTE